MVIHTTNNFLDFSYYYTILVTYRMVEYYEKPHKHNISQQGIACSICRAATDPSSSAYAADGALTVGPHLFFLGRGVHVPAAPTVLETPLYTHS